MTVIGKTARGRIYTRKFNYEDAKQRHAAGESQSALAKKYGVSVSRINQVVNPEIGRRANERSSAFRWICPDCRGPTRGKGCRCWRCFSLASSTTTREGELHCATCHRWLPPEAFSFNRSQGKYARQNRRRHCRECDTRKRQNYRARNYEQEQAYWKIYAQRRREQTQKDEG